jgi:hypothetical protein
MKRKSHTNKKFGKQNGKRVSKKVYKKRTSKRLRKTTKRGRRGSRKMRGGNGKEGDTSVSAISQGVVGALPPFNADQSVILGDENNNDVSVGSINLSNTEDGETDSEARTTTSFSSVTGLSLSGVEAGQQDPNASFNSTDSSLHLSDLQLPLPNASANASISGATDMSTSFDGGKRRKGKKKQKRRRGKKGGENPPTFNSYIDKVSDPYHD